MGRTSKKTLVSRLEHYLSDKFGEFDRIHFEENITTDSGEVSDIIKRRGRGKWKCVSSEGHDILFEKMKDKDIKLIAHMVATDRGDDYRNFM